MSRSVRSAALQAADFLAAVRNEMMNDSNESDDYSEDNDNMNQNNTESQKDLPGNEVEIATQDPDDTSEDEIAVPMADSTQQTNNEFLSTDGSQRWSKVPINPNTGRMRLQNVLNQSPGPISAVVQRSDSVLGTFSCFITTEMLTKIAHYTNEEGQIQIPNSRVDVSVDKFRKYLELRLLAGVYSANKEAITQDAPIHLIHPLLKRRRDARNADALIVREKTIKRHLKFATNAKTRYAKIILKLFVLGAAILIDSKNFPRITIFESKIIFTSNIGQTLSFQQLFGS